MMIRFLFRLALQRRIDAFKMLKFGNAYSHAPGVDDVEHMERMEGARAYIVDGKVAQKIVADASATRAVLKDLDLICEEIERRYGT
jgi:hypothetical protein